MNKYNLNYPGLNALCKYLNAETDYHFDIISVVFFIRHISVATGCYNACIHCFSNSPQQITQTSLDGFKILINEIGSVLSKIQKQLSFFHLGASTDPSSIYNYYKYLELWREAMPNFQILKVFTHGWWLYDSKQLEEFERFIEVVSRNLNIKIVISFDLFSLHARKDWNKYLDNISQNLSAVLKSIGKERVRLEVFYTPDRFYCDEKFTLQFWREQVIGNEIPFKKMMSICNTSSDNICAKVTSGVLYVLSKSGLAPIDLIDMTRDCGCVFPSGRAKNLFEGFSDDDKIEGLRIQERNVLYSLKEYEYKYNGVVIYPDGSAQLVDYLGFKLKGFLNDANPIIPYMTTI